MDASIAGVRVVGARQGAIPVVMLSVEDENDVLPIFIGYSVARSIVRGLDANDIGRPLTHDLLLDSVEELGGRVERVVVSAVEDNTYIADLHLATPRGSTTVDARPSDALALAARTNVPIEISEDVFAEGRVDSEQYADYPDIRNVMDGSTPMSPSSMEGHPDE